MRNPLAFMLLTLAFTSTLLAQNSSSDFEMWNEVDVSAKVSERATLTLPLVIRNSFTLQDPQLGGVGPIVEIEVEKHLTATAGYLFVGLPNTGHGFKVNVPLAAVTLRKSLGPVRLQDRNRAEGLIGIPQDPIRYRNKVIIDLPSPTALWLPFVSDEVFFDFSQSRWSQNRFQIGVGRQITPQFRVDSFYLERSAHRSNPTSTHVIGVTLQVRLTPTAKRKGVSHEEN